MAILLRRLDLDSYAFVLHACGVMGVLEQLMKSKEQAGEVVTMVNSVFQPKAYADSPRIIAEEQRSTSVKNDTSKLHFSNTKVELLSSLFVGWAIYPRRA